MLVMAVGIPATNALTCIGRAAELFWSAAVTTGVTLILIWALDVQLGLVGVAYAILIGNLARSGVRWAIFLWSALRLARTTAI
jgi:O-antigen/teichoic acid export membrane protein